MAAPVIRELWGARQLLDNLVRKELKVRYKHSALGFLWSLLTPIMMTAIFTAIFAVVLRIPVRDFASFFLAGYLVWQFFANSVNSAVGSIVSNGPLIKKVYFPREVIPLSITLSQAVHFLLAVLATAPLFFFQRGNVLPYLPAVGIGLVLLILFTSGMAMIFAAANVRFRDLQELTQVIFLAWFYATPIIYPLFFVADNAPRAFMAAIRLNPMTWFVEFFQTPLYGVAVAADTPDVAQPSLPPGWPAPMTVLGCTVMAVVVFTLGYWMFNRFAVTFAKEI
jgi:ABC-type polysaccharide/polyol phosphate export permease